MVGAAEILTAFLAGVACGVSLCAMRSPKTVTRWPLMQDLMKRAKKQDSKATPSNMTSIPRAMPGWRGQKAAIERDHNSKQKLRDQRIAGL